MSLDALSSPLPCAQTVVQKLSPRQKQELEDSFHLMVSPMHT